MTRHPWLVLAGLLAVLVTVVAIWVGIDRRPAEWDHANHLEHALNCWRDLSEGRIGAVFAASSFYPPVAPCAAGLLYFAFPVTAMTAQAVMLLFLAVGLAALFVLGRALWDTGTGLLAAFFLGTAPFVVYSLLNFQLDVPLMAVVALALSVIWRTEHLERAGWCAVLGVVLGVGMLTKPTFPIYVAGPLAWALVAGWRAGSGRRRLRHVGLAILIAAALALPWYGQRLVGLPFQILDRSFKQAAEADQAPMFSARWLLFYARVFQPQFGLLAGALTVWGLWAIRKDRGARGFLWLATLAPLAVFSAIQNRNLRYTLPILPAAALAAAAGVRALPLRWRRAVVAVSIALAVVQTSMVTFAVPPPPTLSVFLTQLVVSWPPRSADWQHDRILDDLAAAAKGHPATVSVVPNYNFLSVSNLRYEALVRGLPLQVARAWTGPPLGVDFVLLKTGSQGPAFSAARPERITKAFTDDPDLAAIFPIIGEYALPDGSQAILRARRIPPVTVATPAEVAERLRQTQERTLADFVRDPVDLQIAIDYDPEQILRGLVRRVRVTAKAATIGEMQRRDRAPLRVHDVSFEVDDLLVNPHRLMRTGALEVLDAGALAIERAVVTQADVDALLKGQPVGAWLTVRLDAGAADVRLKPLPGSARIGVLPGTPAAPFALQVEDLRFGPIPLGAFLVDWVVRHFDPTARLRNLPVPISIAPIRIEPGRLVIGPA